MPAQRFQFSLRTFFIACTVAAVAIAVVVWRYRAYERRQQAISRVGGSQGDFVGYNASHDCVNLFYYRDRRNRPIAYVLQLFDSYDPNVPAMKRERRERAGVGKMLFVDGEVVEPRDGPVMFVNGPYGHTVRLKLTDQDLATIESIEQSKIRSKARSWREFWRGRVEPEMYLTSGQIVAGERDGRWEYRLADGRLYLQGDYRLGERHGDWTTYFPSGHVQYRAQYEEGKPAGQWEYFDEMGTLLGSVEWDRGHARIAGSRRRGGAISSSFAFHGEQGRETGYRMSEKDGGQFFLHGREVKRPKLDFPLLVAPQD
jgi:hypothetical protein